MLKTVSSVANALGALNYKGTWNATTNTPALASGVGTQGDYYVVSVAGTTNLDGITNWGVGDWAAFNGSVWQRVEGGADGNFDNLTALGTSTLTGNVQIVTGDLTVSAGNVIIGTSGQGIDFSATAGTGTSELLDDYEEGTWTPELRFGGATPSGIVQTSSLGYYTKVGNLVTVQLKIILSSKGAQTGNAEIYGLPFTAGAGGDAGAYSSYFNNLSLTASQVPIGKASGSDIELRYPLNGVTVRMTHGNITDTTDIRMFSSYYI